MSYVILPYVLLFVLGMYCWARGFLVGGRRGVVAVIDMVFGTFGLFCASYGLAVVLLLVQSDIPLVCDGVIP